MLQIRDGTPIQCVVLNDVWSMGSGVVVIPKKSRLFGWKKGSSIEWTSWTTPDRVFVGDATLHGTAAVSEIDPGSDSYAVAVACNISVPESERH